MQQRSRMIRTAPGTSICCDESGRIARIACGGRRYDDLVAIAVRAGEGDRQVVTDRIDDMLACGLLLEEGEGNGG